MDTKITRYSAADLGNFTSRVFEVAGLEPDMASAVADILVEAELLGHATHGLALVPSYLDEIAGGGMSRTGLPKVLSDRGACVAWDGARLPGPWLMTRAIELCCERAGQFGIGTVTIGKSHHIGCLAAYLQRVTERDMVILIFSSAPGSSSVAPFGARNGAISPAPVAIGYPTSEGPVMIDMSASITTNTMAHQMARQGRRYQNPAFVDRDGLPSDDPAILNCGGALLPAGGLDHGHKGYGWALISETMSQGLSGHGRRQVSKGKLNAVLVQVMDPAFFCGTSEFIEQANAISTACRAAVPISKDVPVRLPGAKAIELKRRALVEGVPLSQELVSELSVHGRRLGVLFNALEQP